MVLKKEREYINGPVPVDESWWTAILEDVEAKYGVEIQSIVSNQTNQEDDPESSNEVDWSWIKSIYESDQVIHLDVTDHNRGGVLVASERVQGFVPASHLIDHAKPENDGDRENLLASYVGKSIALKVIECNPEQGRIVLSERAAQAYPGSRLELLKTLEVGTTVRGQVTTITDFGVFIDLGGMEGLLHISELSWGRVRHPEEIVSLGDELEVCIIQIDHDRNRVALSLKRLRPNPWESVNDRYQTGQITAATVTNIVSYGVFARLEDGLDGLLHISELENLLAGKRLEDIFTEGQDIDVCILNIDASRQRLGLSIPNSEG